MSDDQYHTAGDAGRSSPLSAGDLVFWGTSQTDWTTVYHTAIYVGGDQIVEATGDHVQLNSSASGDRATSCRTAAARRRRRRRSASGEGELLRRILGVDRVGPADASRKSASISSAA